MDSPSFLSGLNTHINTSIPTATLNDAWMICYKVYGWGIFAQIPRVSLKQKFTITKAEIYDASLGWTAVTVKSVNIYYLWAHIIFETTLSLSDGLYLCRVSGKVEI